MPVVRSRGGFRFEAGRGYPRLKWSDISKATIIANELQFEERKSLKSERVSKRRSPAGNTEQLEEGLAAEERSQRRRGIFIHNDGESEEGSSDNSLIYSDFRLSPESGRVRMAFTVPLTRLASSEAKQQQQQPVFQSTLQIRHTMVDRLKRQGGTEGGAWKGTGAHFSPCLCDSHSDKGGTDKDRVCNGHSKKIVKSVVAIENPQVTKLQQRRPKDNWKNCAKLPNASQAPVVLKTDSRTYSISHSSPSLPSGVLQDSLCQCRENSICPRPTSFWRDIKAGRKGCLASLKCRLRDATFIIYSGDSETSPPREKRGGSRKPLGSACHTSQRGKLTALSADKTKVSPMPLGLEMNSPLLTSQCLWLPPLEDSPRRPRLSLGFVPAAVPAFPFEVSACSSRRRTPITFTSASHTSLRCYPPLGCHPFVECQPHPSLFPLKASPHHCHHCIVKIPKCYQSQSDLPDGKPDKKKASIEEVGLTIKNLHASMDSEENLVQVESRTRAIVLPPLSDQKHVAVLTSPECSLGQRSSSGSGTLPPRRTNNPPTPSPAHSQTGTPKHSSLTPSTGTAPTKGKKVLKNNLRETGARKSLQTRTKAVSSSSAANSPVSLHGRVLQKTASVSPAPSKPTSTSHSASLTRFGFKSSPLIASGNSTDSVNSILSDAQTVSDANSYVFDFSEENGNGIADPSDLTACSPDTQNETKDSSNVRGVSPCTISQASSGVTSTLLNGKLKAQTRQLPMPQVVTVKTMNNSKKHSSPNGTTRLRYASPISRKEVSPRSQLVTSKDHRSKIPQNANKSSPPKVQRMSRDSESSSKSSNTIDSGLGSSSESDKLRSSEASPPKGEEKPLILPDTQQRKGDDESKVEMDVSDAWLKEKREHQEAKSKSCDLDLKFREGSTCPSSLKQPLTEKPPQKESFKEKRDSSITYGMARQKFAPYNRNRIGYQSSSAKGTSLSGGNSQKDDTVSKAKLGDNGIVRRRIAQLEKTPSVPTNSPNSLTSLKPPRKPVARPTSIEKTPILVSPKTENTVELSRSICRRLEYSEGKGSLLDALKDNKLENHLIELPTTAQDLLMVDSFEVKKEKCLENLPSSANGREISVKLPTKPALDVECENCELKRMKDISECENTTKRLSEDSNGNPATLAVVPENDAEALPHLPLPFPDASAKLFSPDGSETSFEILESGSVDLSPKAEVETAIGNDGFLSRVVSGFTGPASGPIPGAKHAQGSPARVTPLKKCRQDSDNEESSLKAQGQRESTRDSPSHRGPFSDSQTPRSEYQSDSSVKSRGVMESSVDSGRSGDSNLTSEFGDRWTVSGKCTPTLSSTRGDVDQDFLIDDEISDQPGLTFGDELEASFFGDEDLFSDDISSPSASHLLSKTERSRHESLGTISSLGPDDLMLDYDIEESKQTGQPPTSTSPESPRVSPSKGKNTKPRKSLEISIPGPRYEEEVLSPVACDILTEWSAILSDTQSPPRTSQQCVSQQTVGVGAATTSSLGTALNASPVANINTHQPKSITKEGLDDCTLNVRSFPARSRTASAGPDYCTADIRKGVNFKPPRQGVSCEHEGGINIDRTTLHYICQDVTTMKTLLLRLRRVLQVADTINPFDSNLKTSLYLSLGANESCCEREEPHSSQDVVQQNVDLKRQVVLLQQRLEEKDRTIRILQQQLAHALLQTNMLAAPCNSSGTHLTPPSSPGAGEAISSPPKSVSNAATQTERLGPRSSPFNLAAMSRTSSIEDGLGPTVSFETASGRSDCSSTSNLDPSVEEGKKQSSPEKFSEFLASPSPKLPLMPAASPVAGSLAS